MGVTLLPDQALAGRTTLGLGGSAQWLAQATSRSEVVETVAWAQAEGFDLTVLGGGSNVVIADAGLLGVVLCPQLRGFRVVGDWVVAAAGESWDDLVAATVEAGLTGLECLSGIPGTVGATPIQNVGAYGCEVAETIEAVEVFDRELGAVFTLAPAACRFGYRTSRFKLEPNRWIVLAVHFRLARGTPQPPRSAEVVERLGAAPTGRELRQAVLAVRASKSMVLADDDPNRRSVGSFFTNPTVDALVAANLLAAASAQGWRPDLVPHWHVAGGGVKLSAAWLIEQSGFPRGTREGVVGQSSRHALALVHHGGGSSRELLAYAGRVRSAVLETWGVALAVEPVLLGFATADPAVEALGITR